MDFLNVFHAPFKRHRLISPYGFFHVHIIPCKYQLLLSLGTTGTLQFEMRFCNMTSARCFHFGRLFRKPPHPRVFAEKKFVSHRNEGHFRSGYGLLNDCSESFVKLDAEGSELNWLEHLQYDTQKNIQQMLIVVKDLHKNAYRKKSIFSKLNSTHLITHIQPIWKYGLEQHPDGFPVPKKMVIQYINQKWFDEYPDLNRESFPWSSDSVDKHWFRLEHPPFCRLQDDALIKYSSRSPKSVHGS